MQSPESAVSTFGTSYGRVLYNEPNSFPQFSGKLAPLTGTALNTTYVCGQLLAYYNVHAPMGLAGQFVNYSAASLNDDQNVAVAILTQENMQNVVGGDGNFYQIAWLSAPLVLSGSQMALANEPDDITAFLSDFSPYAPLPGSLLGAAYNGTNDQVYILK